MRGATIATQSMLPSSWPLDLNITRQADDVKKPPLYAGAFSAPFVIAERKANVRDHSTVRNETQRYTYITREQLRSLPNAALRVFVAVKIYANNITGECFPSLMQLMSDTGLSRATVYRGITLLESLGYVERDGDVFRCHATPKVVHLSHQRDTSLTRETKILISETPLHILTKPINSTIHSDVLEDQTRSTEDTMPTKLSNLHSSSGDGDDLPKPKRPAKSSKFTDRRRCADHIAQYTRSTCLDAVKLDPIIKEFGLDETLLIIDEAWRNRESLINERFPNFTAGTIHMYATYRYRRNRPQTSLYKSFRFEEELAKATRNGKLDLNIVRNIVNVFGLRREDLQGKISEPELDKVFRS